VIVDHADHSTDIEETLGTLTDLVRQGRSALSAARRSRSRRSSKNSTSPNAAPYSGFAPNNPRFHCSPVASRLDDLLTGAALTLDDDILDRIDEIVPPGTNVYEPDGAWGPPSLNDPALRRRPLGDRAAC
jgi:hypothetical protein